MEEDTKNILLYLRFFVGLYVPCHISEASRAQKEEKKKSREWFKHTFADMCLHNCGL